MDTTKDILAHRGDDYEMEKAYRLIDGDRDLEIAKIDAAQRFVGKPASFRGN